MELLSSLNSTTENQKRKLEYLSPTETTFQELSSQMEFDKMELSIRKE